MNGYLKLELDFFYLRCRASATQLLLLVRDDREPALAASPRPPSKDASK
jgi:hypothetical protein